MAFVANRLKTLIEHIIDDQAATDKKVIDTGGHGIFQHLIHVSQPNLVGIDEYNEFFLALYFCLLELLVNVVCHKNRSIGCHNKRKGKLISANTDRSAAV